MSTEGVARASLDGFTDWYLDVSDPSGGAVDSASIEALVEAVRGLDLPGLSLVETGTVDDGDVERIRSGLPGLRHLFLSGDRMPANASGIQVTDAGVAEIAKMRRLRSLELSSFGGVTDVGVRRICESLGELRRLHVGGCRAVTDESLSDLRRLEHLTVLRLDGMWPMPHVTDRGLELVAGIGTLEELSLGNCPSITSAGVAHLAGAPGLKALALRDCDGVSNAGLEALAEASALERLVLEDCDGVTPSGLQSLRELPRLESLDLSWSSFRSELRELEGLRLTTLRAAHSRSLGDESLRAIATISTLVELDIYDCEAVTDDGVASLAGHRSLRRLRLSACKRVGNAGIAALAEGVELTTLEAESLPRLTDDGVKELSTMSSLRRLDLSGCRRITDEGVVALAELAGLQRLDVSGCRSVSQAAVERLRSALPDCEIVLD